MKEATRKEEQKSSSTLEIGKNRGNQNGKSTLPLPQRCHVFEGYGFVAKIWRGRICLL
jgi:hypothetical protein